MSIVPENQAINKFTDNVLETCVDSSVFSSEIWTGIRDNDVIRHLKDQFYMARFHSHGN